MRILVVTSLWPWIGQAGGAMRIEKISQAFAQRAEVDLFVFSRIPGFTIEGRGPSFSRVGFEPEPGLMGVAGLEAFISAVGLFVPRERILVWLSRRRAKKSLHKFTDGQNYDLVWYVRESTWLRTRGVVKAPEVVDIDDFQEVLLARWMVLGKNARGIDQNIFGLRRMRVEANWWSRVHAKASAAADAVVVSSKSDVDRIGHGSVFDLPNTYELDADEVVESVPRVRSASTPPLMMFVGLLSWAPNADGVGWFIDEVLPLIRLEIPNASLVVIGQGAERIHQYASVPGVEITGPIHDLRPWLERADISVVPMRVGSGTRIKILEAFCHRLPVVSTSIGAEGLGTRHAENILIADEAQDFARQCVELLRNPARRSEIASAAWVYSRENFGNRVISHKIDEIVEFATGGRHNSQS